MQEHGRRGGGCGGHWHHRLSELGSHLRDDAATGTAATRLQCAERKPDAERKKDTRLPLRTISLYLNAPKKGQKETANRKA